MAKLNDSGHLIYDKITYPSVVQANYLASTQDEYIVDDIINFYTHLMPWNIGTPPCSHTEIGFWVDGELWFFSSTSRAELGSSGKNGTRWRKATDLLHNPDRWLLQEKTIIYTTGNGNDTGRVITPEDLIGEKIQRANDLIGLEYDFARVFTDFIIPWAIFHGVELTPELIAKLKAIYCSKAVHAVDTGRLEAMSPKRRFKVAEKAGYNIIANTEAFMILRGQMK